MLTVHGFIEGVRDTFSITGPEVFDYTDERVGADQGESLLEVVGESSSGLDATVARPAACESHFCSDCSNPGTRR